MKKLFLLISISVIATGIKSQIYSPKPIQTQWDEYSIKLSWKERGMDELEGIYEDVTAIHSNWPHDILAVKKTNIGYSLIFLADSNAESFSKSRNSGELYMTLTPTATKYLFKSDLRGIDWYSSFENGFLKNYRILSSGELGRIDRYLKIYPVVDNLQSQQPQKSGTGFAISSNGVIVTNYHVIDGAKSISVKGINSNFDKSYSAKVLVSDKNNDLSLIQIDDPEFKSLGIIPFTIKSIPSGVGESVFVLGYPLRASMGDEIKITNGIISSKTGYQGDITAYQISAPIQPGNSGGPLFDSNGNLIGIINAKLTGAENATYAIKSSYLCNLTDALVCPLKFQTTNLLISKSLPSQVNIIKKFVYIIEIN